MERLRSNPWVVLVVLCTGFFMIMLDTNIINIAIPAMMTSFQASLDQILWVMNGYVLVYAVLLISAGRLGDIFGQRNLFAGGMAIFVVASALCGLSQDINQLIAARFIQGVGGALLTPQTLTILTSIFPPDRRGAAFGIWGAVAGIAGAAGPMLGGLIVTNLTWPWVFFVNVPIGIAALIATFLIVPDLRVGKQHSLDLVGVLLATTGLLAIVFGLVEGEHYSWGTVWSSLTIPEIIALGVVILGAFLVWERFPREPLVPFSLFRDRNYSLMNWLGVVMSLGLVGLMLPGTIYFQGVLGMSALQAGLLMAPAALVGIVVAPIAGRLTDKIGGKIILIVGLLVVTGGMASFALIAAPDTTWQTLLLPMVAFGAGQGCVFTTMYTIAMRDMTPKMAGAASSVINTTRQVGFVLGSAVMGALLQNQLATHLQQQAELRAGELPAMVQQPFIQGVSTMFKGGLFAGSLQGGQQAMAGVPSQLAEQMARLGKLVFANGFVDAMVPTLVISAAILLVAVLSCLAIRGRDRDGSLLVGMENPGTAEPA